MNMPATSSIAGAFNSDISAESPSQGMIPYDTYAHNSPNSFSDQFVQQPPPPPPPPQEQQKQQSPRSSKPPLPPKSRSPSDSASTTKTPPPNSTRIEKRTKNTLAARRYRQKRVDQMCDLEQALKTTEDERDELKVRVARLEGEVETLRQLLLSKS
ncbi:hypothetical protein BP6252_05676 [Coleophoma cylindrospora]|uniref:BZIP domain-containing protein n=1 Tax=Coleophoma cylindrospora TaxID=1849047 RepID=A0A3D8RU99_9HELO|nr:hypothetical protein BP6252_05676 [Coleophoma cylindrospora]